MIRITKVAMHELGREKRAITFSLDLFALAIMVGLILMFAFAYKPHKYVDALYDRHTREYMRTCLEILQLTTISQQDTKDLSYLTFQRDLFREAEEGLIEMLTFFPYPTTGDATLSNLESRFAADIFSTNNEGVDAATEEIILMGEGTRQNPDIHLPQGPDSIEDDLVSLQQRIQDDLLGYLRGNPLIESHCLPVITNFTRRRLIDLCIEATSVDPLAVRFDGSEGVYECDAVNLLSGMRGVIMWRGFLLDAASNLLRSKLEWLIPDREFRFVLKNLNTTKTILVASKEIYETPDDAEFRRRLYSDWGENILVYRESVDYHTPLAIRVEGYPSDFFPPSTWTRLELYFWRSA